ncbi:hypothetical protein BH09PAT1_BH09PAT1_1270 [soil metagenome]
MENHPIPRDVTGFQFKLIGNMAVKQFAYLATGGVLAVVFYYAPVFILLKLFVIPFFGGLGAALAFLPIEGRPMDLMLTNFVKDLFAPTQYIYQKEGGMLAISMISTQPPKVLKKGAKPKKSNDDKQYEREVKLNEFLSHLSHSTRTKLDEKEDIFLSAIFDPNATPQLISLFQQKAAAGETLSEEEALRVKMIQSPEDMEHQLEREAEAIKQELAQAVSEEQKLAQEHQATTIVHTHVSDLEKQLNDMMLQKQQLEQELQKLKTHMAAPAPATTVKVDEPIAQQSQNVRIVPSDKASSVGLPEVPDVPNIVIGIIRDPRGNVLPGILVEIKDKDGNPVRAFKTNGLGHFASATPLSNGIYTIIFEDMKGKQEFEMVQIEAKGEIMLPLEIISQDAREELRKELFN